MKKIAFIILFITIILSASLYFGSNTVEKLFYPMEYRPLIVAYSNKYSLDPYLVAAVIYEESHFNSDAKSDAGAVGLMQIMPNTASWISKILKEKKVNEAELINPTTNIRFGCWYLSFLKKRYKNDELALAAYNAGFQNVDKWLNQSRSEGTSIEQVEIHFDETREFVKRVKATKKIYKEIYREELSR